MDMKQKAVFQIHRIYNEKILQVLKWIGVPAPSA